MKEFSLIFRTSPNPDFNPTPAQMQEMMTGWSNWMGGIAARGQLASSGSRLGIREAKSVGPGGVVSDGPYTEIKEFINGFMTVKVNSVDEAVEIAKGCPMLQGDGNSVEVRRLVAPDDNE